MGAKKATKKPPKLVAPGRAQASAAAVATSVPTPAPKASKPKHAKGGKAKKQQRGERFKASDDAILVMRKQLAAIGCKLFEVEADGNCLFRSIGDQLFGDQHQHLEIRKRIVDYIELKRDDFEPFMEDEEKFEHYCKRMREDGTWGGNQELYAAARNFQVYVVIHQESSRMVIECDALKPRKIIHVAYHGSDHYDSVRALQDTDLYDQRAPQEIVLDCDGFRPEDFAKRWKVHANATASQQQQRIAASSGDGQEEEEQEETLMRGIDALQVAAKEGEDASPLSKKELRKLKKDAKKTSGKR